MAGMTYDGIPSTQELSEQVSGTNIQGTTGTFVSLSLTNGVSGTNVSLEYPVAYTGSPVVGNNAIQYGTANAAGIANAVTVSFGKAFAAAPQVVVSATGSVAVGLYVAGVSAGSFVFNGAGSNIAHSWFAMGSGRI